MADPRFDEIYARLDAIEKALSIKKQPKAEAAVAPLAGAKRATAKKGAK